MSFALTSYNLQIPAVKIEFHGWPSRKERLLRTLPTLGDILTLQESSYCESEQGQNVSTTLQEAGFSGFEPARLDPQLYPDVFHHRIPIFWKTDMFTLLSSNMTLISTGTCEQQEKFPNMENRYSSHVELLREDNGQIIHIFNLHLQHVVHTDIEAIVEYATVQKMSLQRLEEFITATVHKDEMVFIAGDFNMVDPQVENFASAAEMTDTPVNVNYPSYHGYRPAFPDMDSRIDHILSNCEPKDILKYEVDITVDGSDHYPVTATIL